MRTEGRTNKMNLIVTFRNFAKRLKSIMVSITVIVRVVAVTNPDTKQR